MNETMPGIRRLCIAVAADRDGRPSSAPGSPVAPSPLADVLDETCAAAELECAHWITQHGAGELAIFPPGIDEGRVVTGFVRELRLAVLQANDAATPRLRLRVALHQGITYVDEQGYGGRAVIKACRLRDADVLGRELAENPESDLALIVSAELFDDVTDDDHPDLRRADFRPVTVDVPERGPRSLAWVLTPAPFVRPVLAGPVWGLDGPGRPARPAGPTGQRDLPPLPASPTRATTTGAVPRGPGSPSAAPGDVAGMA